MFEYKGYMGEVSYDDQADVLYIKVVNSGPYSVADAEATDLEGLKREFRKSIEVYLDGCAELGVRPVKPTTQSVPTEVLSQTG